MPVTSFPLQNDRLNSWLVCFALKKNALRDQNRAFGKNKITTIFITTKNGHPQRQPLKKPETVNLP